MDVVNSYAARLAATDGVSSLDGYPSYFEATGGRATLATGVTSKPGTTSAGKLSFVLSTWPLDVGTDVLNDVILDEPIPGRIRVGEVVTLSGTVTATDG